MKKIATLIAVVAFITTVAFAQSSGNFSATGSGAACTIDSTKGTLSGGLPVSSFTTYVSTSNGNGVTLDIRPSLVTGLFTDTKISTSIPTATADVGIQVCVSVDGSAIDGSSPSPVQPAPCVTYDQRFQQISSQLFSQLSACTTTTTCDLTAVPPITCGTGFTCSSSTGPGVCLNDLCNFDLVLSTLSAHSFDFVVPVGQGKPHTIVTSWSTTGTPTSSSSNVMSCVGPGITTVTQTKVFNNSGSLSF
jgi:hypothetical protein